MYTPWESLEKYRGKEFKGEWPTISEMFRITAGNYPKNKVFTSFHPVEISLTYEEALKYVDEVSQYLASIGIKKGDKVAVTGKNSPEWAVSFLAILNLGAVVVPIDTALSKEDVVDLIRKSDSKAIFTDKDKYEYIKEKSSEIIDAFSLTPEHENYILDLKSEGQSVLEAAVENDVAAILFTSGTTGVSKGVMLTHKNFSSDVWLAQSNMKLYSTDVFYALLPIHHSYTMTSVFLESIFIGAEIVFGKQLVFPLIMDDLKRGRVTMFLGVPMLFNKLIHGLLSGVKKKGIILYAIIRFLMSISGFIKKTLKVNPGKAMFSFLLKQVSLENVRICISGGGPLAPSTFKHFNQLGIDFVQGYGLTETSPMLTLNPIENYKETSVGRVIAQVEMKIINKDEDGVGDIVVKGPNVMKGYYKQEAATAEAYTEDGYLKTGDAGYLDKDNYLYLTGRKASLIVTEGGKNVYPEEIEDAFQFYDEYEQILVKGYVKNKETLSEGIEIAFYPAEEFSAGKTFDEIKTVFKNIVSEVNKSLISYKRIDKVHVLRKALPMTTTRKIKRNEVNKRFEEFKKI